ncbi:MAG TPA: Dabb family protein [Pyrinomonadaceae bacterium]|jgi:hypothetical protein
MLTHIVIWKYLADAEQAARESHIAALQNLPALISEIESFKAGFDMLRLPRSFDAGLVAAFRDRAALHAYTIHPEHVRALELGRAIIEHVASVDFEDEEQA